MTFIFISNVIDVLYWYLRLVVNHNYYILEDIMDLKANVVKKDSHAFCLIYFYS